MPCQSTLVASAPCGVAAACWHVGCVGWRCRADSGDDRSQDVARDYPEFSFSKSRASLQLPQLVLLLGFSSVLVFFCHHLGSPLSFPDATQLQPLSYT